MNNISVLSDLDIGKTARISRLICNEHIRRRLQDIGIIPGTLVECVMKSPFGDPAAYFIRGAVIAIRNSDAGNIPIICSGGDSHDGA